MKENEHDTLVKNILEEQADSLAMLKNKFKNLDVERIDRQGTLIDLYEWIILSNDSRYRDVKIDKLGEFYVITYWTGYLFQPFESLVTKGDRLLDSCGTFSEDDALHFHEKAVFMIDQKLTNSIFF